MYKDSNAKSRRSKQVEPGWTTLPPCGRRALPALEQGQGGGTPAPRLRRRDSRGSSRSGCAAWAPHRHPPSPPSHPAPPACSAPLQGKRRTSLLGVTFGQHASNGSAVSCRITAINISLHGAVEIVHSEVLTSCFTPIHQHAWSIYSCDRKQLWSCRRDGGTETAFEARSRLPTT